ncbi:MAG: RHH-type proline utilization regulon transcriptional repressor/proline dehydrogenase [Candidatus Azotimanducaceae bacterium]|jgi:RHH-type proline utilization regulon transcriptional repressor/proline dehydrogenase/delta 1-pyrroline-5-carboxylate dehydrogenase
MQLATSLKDTPLTLLDDDELNSIRAMHVADEAEVLELLISSARIDSSQRWRIQDRAVSLIERMRSSSQPGLMEMFLAEYGLSTNEGIALMCLAEALLRVPDPGTIDALIEDKIAPYDWDKHFGHSGSSVVNASTVALMLTGRLLDEDNSSSVSGLLNRTVKRLGEPVVRMAVKQSMREMGNQFVLGQTIEQALKRGRGEMKRGFLYSYDMLGEAALTQADADEYYESYANAIHAIGKQAGDGPLIDQPGISVKLSALHPRFEYAKTQRLLKELAPRLNSLAKLAKKYNLGLNVDAEEARRVEPFLHVVKAALSDPKLAGWDGFGLVIQAYGKRAAPIIDWLYALATKLDRKVMVRLVKGAYWDSEIKQAQIDGASDYPVFTRRVATDISYTCCAARLLRMTDRIYPQFATHNGQTAAAILELATDPNAYEFQRLHGMGESLHNHLLEDEGARCRIYAPVGPHKDLLAYLVRRLLENGANSSFVNQVVDPRFSALALAADPFDSLPEIQTGLPNRLVASADIYAPDRVAAKGWDLQNNDVVRQIDLAREHYIDYQWHAEPIVAGEFIGKPSKQVYNPAVSADVVGTVIEATCEDCSQATDLANSWEHAGASERSFTLRRASELIEDSFGELIALLAREAGKTQVDAIAELREAVDFLRYYANQGDAQVDGEPRGIITCISPWNFPLAIFTGQIAAALAAGNGVLAKPAETTPLIAAAVVKLLHTAGVPRDVLQLLPGDGIEVGQALVSHPHIKGVCFTGSTVTAQAINRMMAEHLTPDATLIAETGGINAGVVDSTALPEQAVRDTLVSAFQSAGQRCSALRVLYVQEDVADGFLEMLSGAMDELELGNPWALETDIGPIISKQAQQDIQTYIDTARKEGRLLKQLATPAEGNFVGPAIIEVNGIEDLDHEVFGPVLHVARFKAEHFDAVLDTINRRGFGLTFGLHTRIDERAKVISNRLQMGNIYVNRNQVGAVVESQPFGGEGLSGTGPKAGGPHYVPRFQQQERICSDAITGSSVPLQQLQAGIDALYWHEPMPLDEQEMLGITGESNKLTLWPRGTVLCLGPTVQDALAQTGAARRMGCPALTVVPGAKGVDCIDGFLDRADLTQLQGIEVVALWSHDDDLRAARKALAARPGKILPLVANEYLESYCRLERHTCIDTTAAGGNASLLASVES